MKSSSIWSKNVSDTPQRYAIESGVCCVNGKPAKIGTIIKNGDRIENIVHRHEPPVTSIPVKVMKVDTEKELIVIDKPGSIASTQWTNYPSSDVLSSQYMRLVGITKTVSSRFCKPILGLRKSTVGYFLISVSETYLSLL
jgi:23S rRNA-/tRNA-specific pseudouridylate synthase